MEFPKYRCHKIVGAVKIKSIEEGTVVPDDDAVPVFFVTDEWTKKHEPKAGGYFVQYENGYTSWSPADAFEAGYTRI